MKVGYLYDPIYLKHDTGQHVENASRLEAIMSRLEQSGIKAKLTSIQPRPATIEELSLVHHEYHIRHVREVAQSGGGWLDPDTIVSRDSYDAALFAAGGAIRAAEAVMTGEVDSAFALVRPPGHHATPGQAMGFCLFNNIAIAARHVAARFSLDRILIIDFDVHHGNGTQEVFYDEPRVAYMSTHQYPYYPGSGSIEETGGGPAKGTKVNIPLPAGCGDAEYDQVYEQIIAPSARRFHPQLILVSAGYDTHWADGLAFMRVTVRGFARIVKNIRDLASELCSGRVALTLEGGYNLTALSASVKATFDVLLGNTDVEDPLGPPRGKPPAPDLTSLVESIRKIHRLV